MNSQPITLSRHVAVVLLAVVYSLAFIITPYWTRAASATTVALVLLLTVSTGIVWTFLCAAELRAQWGPWKWRYVLAPAGILFLLNMRALTSDIPWRGDEEYHIATTLSLAAGLPTKWLIVFILGVVALLVMARRTSRWTIPVGLLLVASVIVAFLVTRPWSGVSTAVLFRYPFISYWAIVLPLHLATLAGASPYHEILFRILPFCSAIALTWAFTLHVREAAEFPGALWGVAVGTIPVVFYYSSILYLELPAVVLMFLVCANGHALLTQSVPKVMQHPAWYALVLVGFIKETTICFLVCYLACRLIGRRGREIFDEVRLSLAIMLPALLYLFLRRTLSRQDRTAAVTLQTLWDIDVYRTILLSFVEQFGPIMLVLFLAGCVWLVLHGQYVVVAFYLSVCLAYPMFHALDVKAFTGYSRFNLFVVPPILAGSSALIRQLARRRMAAAVAAVATIVAHLYMAPVNLDGSKKPLWGSYLTDTSEHYYPYREALQWLKTNHSKDRVMLTGMYYPYSFSFTFKQLKWEPDNVVSAIRPEEVEGLSESERVSQKLEEADNDNRTVVLYQVLGRDLPQEIRTGQYKEARVFRNQAHALIAYVRSASLPRR
jgi:hypothetical protein